MLGQDGTGDSEIPTGVAAEGAVATVEDAGEGGLAGEAVGDDFLVGAEIGGVGELGFGEGFGDAFPTPARKFSDKMPGAFYCLEPCRLTI
jgi:hypothetical protein